MQSASFRFYAELNDFLPPERRTGPFDYSFEGRQTVKHLIESLGVPHTEVDLMLVNGRSVDFAELIADGDIVFFAPPLVITEVEIDRMVGVARDAAKAVLGA